MLWEWFAHIRLMYIEAQSRGLRLRFLILTLLVSKRISHWFATILGEHKEYAQTKTHTPLIPLISLIQSVIQSNRYQNSAVVQPGTPYLPPNSQPDQSRLLHRRKIDSRSLAACQSGRKSCLLLRLSLEHQAGHWTYFQYLPHDSEAAVAELEMCCLVGCMLPLPSARCF
jgi:hypothetical protein